MYLLIPISLMHIFSASCDKQSGLIVYLALCVLIELERKTEEGAHGKSWYKYNSLQGSEDDS
jgi:hypothetical protein